MQLLISSGSHHSFWLLHHRNYRNEFTQSEHDLRCSTCRHGEWTKQSTSGVHRNMLSAHHRMLQLQGFPKIRSEKAVFHTHSCGVEPAVHWLMEHCEDADIDTPLNLAVGQYRQQQYMHSILTISCVSH